LFVLIARLIEMRDRPVEVPRIVVPEKKEKSGGLFSWMRSGRKEKKHYKKSDTSEIYIPVQKQMEFTEGSVIRLRSKPETLSEADIKAIIKRYNFYDRNINPSGQFQNAYKDNHDGTVTDGRTGLMWQQAGSNKYIKMKNIDQLNKQKYAGYLDWRLPTVEELMSLMENKKMNGDLYIDPVFNNKQRWCWTSDKRSSSSSWVVYFNYGYVYCHLFDYGYVRAVRFGQ
jgi:hypothetical protein